MEHRIVATMPVRNEDWCLAYTLRHLLTWVDMVVVFLHACEDKSHAIVRHIDRQQPGRLSVIVEPDPVWREATHRQTMLNCARILGASHIVLVDADEVLTQNLVAPIRAIITQTRPDAILQLPWVCLARSLRQYYAAGPWFNNWVTTAFQDSPESCWQAPNGYDFHHRHPFGRPARFHRPITQSADSSHGGGLMHLQFLSERRLRAKQALYKLTERLRWPDRISLDKLNEMYNFAVYGSDLSRNPVAECHSTWWGDAYMEAEVERSIDINAAPWQEAECRRLVREYPHLREGLDLFGVV
jgi:hypothetical protein